MQETESSVLRVNSKTKEVTYNPTVEQLFAPEVMYSHNIHVQHCSACSITPVVLVNAKPTLLA